MSISAMKYALQSLEDPWGSGPEGVANAIAFLRQAIAEAEKPDLARVGEVGIWGDKREWVGLTDGEYTTLFRASENLLGFCHAVESKLKEKNA